MEAIVEIGNVYSALYLESVHSLLYGHTVHRDLSPPHVLAK